MTNDDKIVEYINRWVSLDEQEAEIFSAAFKEQKVKKRQFIVQPNFVVKSRHFVLNGAFRAYV